MADVQWYYARNSQQFGPVSAGELKQLADAGNLAPDDLLWREGMDAWTTAINLRGLFPDGPADAAVKVANNPAVSTPESSVRPAGKASGSNGSPLRAILRSTEVTLWGLCVLVVLFGLAAFTRAFLVADDPGKEAAAAAVFSTFFIAAYVLARCGEKLSRHIIARSRRRQ